MASSAAVPAGRGERFQGSSARELGEWLASGGIALAAYGTGSAKTVEQLWEEVEAGETQLFLQDGRPVREVSVLNVLLRNGQGQTLYEAEQVLPNGSRRSRGLPLSEKLLPGERWQDAVVRGVVEELGPVLPAEPQVRCCASGAVRRDGLHRQCCTSPGAPPVRLAVSYMARGPGMVQVEVDEASMVETLEIKESQSYPGLLSKYVCKRVSARVATGLPEGDFSTSEERSDGLLQHCWVWR